MTVSKQDRTSLRAARFLQDCVGEFAVDSSGVMSFKFGSTQVDVWVSENTEQAITLVRFRALVARHVPVTDALYRWVATATNEFTFGRLTLSFESDAEDMAELNIEHTLLGDRLDLEEVREAVSAVASTSDHLDDLVVSRFGGQRFIDP